MLDLKRLITISVVDSSPNNYFIRYIEEVYRRNSKMTRTELMESVGVMRELTKYCNHATKSNLIKS